MYMINIPEIVKKIGINLNDCVVISSGTLHVLGIREANDIDLVAIPGVYESLFTDSSYEHVKTFSGAINLQKTIDGVEVEILPKLHWEAYTKTAEEVIKDAFEVDGVKFMNLDDVKNFKKALGREKDFKDLVLIEGFEKDCL